MGGAIALGGYHFITKNQENSTFSFSSQGDSTHVAQTNFRQVANFNFDENSFINASKKTVNSGCPREEYDHSARDHFYL